MSLNKTTIEWVKNPDGTQGYTWNPITGCLNHTPEGLCLGGMFPCYAYKLANGRLRHKYLWNDNFAPVIEASKSLGGKPVSLPMLNPFYPRFWEERLKELPDYTQWNFLPSRGRNKILRAKARESRGIFVCDMGELFGDWLPKEWTKRVMKTIKNDPRDRFYLLTKQPQNLPQFSPFPDNCWVGVTATDSTMFAAAYYHLADIEAKVKYISIEPLLDWDNRVTEAMIYQASQAGVGWLIIGAQTKPLKLPDISWVTEIIEAGDKAGIPIFLKNNLAPLGKLIADFCGKKDWQLRQEMPK